VAKYIGRELIGREPIETLEFESRHAPEESISLRYYVKTRGDLVKVAKEIARDETTGKWIDAGEPTQTFNNAQADIYRIDRYGENEGVIYVRSPLFNINLDSDLLYQFLMLTIGGPILEFVYYDGVAFLDFDLPPAMLKRFRGPQFGLGGTRKLLNMSDDTPIIGTIVKPCAGLTPDEVARKCYEAALGGVRFIKDDEKMFSPDYCPAEKKIKTVAEKLADAEAKTGMKTLYAPHIVARCDRIKEVCLKAIEWGATALMFNPIAQGFGTLQMLAEDPEINVPIYAHSGGRSGWSTGPRRVDDVVFVKLLRLAGGDYFQTGVMGQRECHVASLLPDMLIRLKEEMTKPLDGIKDMAVVTAGGLNARNLVDNLNAFGCDFMALAGTSILKHPLGIKAGVDAMLQAVEAWRSGKSLDDYARDHKELRIALEEL